MQQVTWRAPDEVVERARSVAAEEGRSLNAYLTFVVDAVTDPSTGGSDRQRLRDRLARAGLLDESGASRKAPDPDAVAAAGRRAAHGTLLSDIVSRDRG